MEMTLDNVELAKLLPAFMRRQADITAMAGELDGVFRYMGARLKLCSVWDQIDNLPEEFLDALARELDMTWYSNSADIMEKRRLIRNADYVHRHKATVWAVQSVASDIFGDAEIHEWFSYGGTPLHYKIEVLSATPEEMQYLLRRLSSVVRVSAVLDEIISTEAMNIGLAEYSATGTTYIMPPLTVDA